MRLNMYNAGALPEIPEPRLTPFYYRSAVHKMSHNNRQVCTFYNIYTLCFYTNADIDTLSNRTRGGGVPDVHRYVRTCIFVQVRRRLSNACLLSVVEEEMPAALLMSSYFRPFFPFPSKARGWHEILDAISSFAVSFHSRLCQN